MILKLIWALKSLMFPLESLVCWLLSLLNNPSPGDRPAFCQIFFLCDFSQDLLSFKIGKIEQTENQLFIIFLFVFPADHLKKKKLQNCFDSFCKVFLLIKKWKKAKGTGVIFPFCSTKRETKINFNPIGFKSHTLSLFLVRNMNYLRQLPNRFLLLLPTRHTIFQSAIIKINRKIPTDTKGSWVRQNHNNFN